MTPEGWKLLVVDAVRRSENGQDEPLDLLALLLNQQDEAKSELSRRGYGVTGTPWPQVVREVPDLKDL